MEDGSPSYWKRSMPTAPPGEDMRPLSGGRPAEQEWDEMVDGDVGMGWELQHWLLQGRSYGVERGAW